MAVSRLLLPLLLAAIVAAPSARAEGPDLGEQNLGRLGFLKHYKEEIETARAGDCGPLLAAARPRDPLEADDQGTIPGAEKMRGVTVTDMWDRGLCVPKDPERGAALEAILGAVEWVPKYDLSWYHPLRWRPLYLDQGWRAWHGYGRSRDKLAARAFIAEGLVLDHWRWEEADFGKATDLGRPLPPYASHVVNWIRNQLREDDSRIAFALSLVKDGVNAPGGVYIEPAPEIGARILSRMDHSAEAMYQFALLLRDGFFVEERRSSWFSEMLGAAHCGHVDAMLEMVQHELMLVENGYRPAVYSAIAWLWLLFDMGYDTVPRIRQLAAKHKVSGARESYLELISIMEKKSPACA
jgi:hypothetical protein